MTSSTHSHQKKIESLRRQISELEAERHSNLTASRRIAMVIGIALTGAVLFAGGIALSNIINVVGCNDDQLFCFVPGAMPKTYEINHNFQQLSRDIEILRSDLQYQINAGSDIETTGAPGTIVFRHCENENDDSDTRYECTPRECISLCIANGERMATIDEMYAFASAGKDHCQFNWMLDPDVQKPVRAYPMYHNRTASGCGPLNTGDLPRIIGYETSDWDSTDVYDCACAKFGVLSD